MSKHQIICFYMLSHSPPGYCYKKCSGASITVFIQLHLSVHFDTTIFYELNSSCLYTILTVRTVTTCLGTVPFSKLMIPHK